MAHVVAELTLAPPDVVRSTIAARFLGQPNEPALLGAILLKQHQLSAIRRIREAIAEFGGAVLCDPAGTGKTYTALGCARGAKSILVVAPAVLKTMWLDASSGTRQKIEFISYSELSREKGSSQKFEFVILDEAHHLRNPGTRRYKALSQIAGRSPCLMLTATPIHNRRQDLVVLLRLVLGARAQRLTPAELSRCVIRRDSLASELSIPDRADMIWHELSACDSIPDQILALPPPLAPIDGGDGGFLIAHSLIRQWASSDAALLGALRRRLVQATALLSALEDGTLPSRSELRSWIAGEDDVQLSFAGMLASAKADACALANVVRAHRDGIVSLLTTIGANTADDERARIIEAIRQEHPNERIVAFGSYADTVDAMFARLSPSGRVAVLTSSGGRVAGGRITRADALAQFAPAVDNSRKIKASDEITLLITTDLLSEGVNLQNASVVIHLDLPWTPARLEQRLGRIARIGSHHSRVVAHAFRPPASAEMLIHIEDILRRKTMDVTLESSARTISEEIRHLLESWRMRSDVAESGVACAVQAQDSGFIALLESNSDFHLVASRGGEISDAPADVVDSLRTSSGKPVVIDDQEISACHRAVIEWGQSMRGLYDVAAVHSDARGTALRCVTQLLQSARVVDRARIALLASRVRSRLRGRLTQHDEEVLSHHVKGYEARADWLSSLLENLHDGSPHMSEVSPRVIALIVHKRRNALSRATER